MTEVRYATDGDAEFWFTLDRHMDKDLFYKKVSDKEGLIIIEDGIKKGILRYNLFWDNTPFCNLIYIEQCSRKKGLGRELMNFWENEMKSRGYGMVMTSTQADEEAQHFYRKLGYKDCGGFILEIPGYEQPMEMFLCKAL